MSEFRSRLHPPHNRFLTGKLDSLSFQSAEMPSSEPPKWRGVSTSTPSPTVCLVLQEIARIGSTLQEMRVTDTAEGPSEKGSGLTASELEDIAKSCGCSTFLRTLERGEQLRQKVQNVVKENFDLKQEMATFLDKSRSAREQFMEETKDLHAELEHLRAELNLQKVQSCISKPERASWSTVLGQSGRHFLQKIGSTMRSISQVLAFPNQEIEQAAYYSISLSYF